MRPLEKYSDSVVGCAQAAEMMFEIWTRVGPRRMRLVECTVAPPGEYLWTVHMRRRCGLFSFAKLRVTNRRSIAERSGCFQRRTFVSLSVCQFVCQHDNFRTIKRRTMKPGDNVHSTKISPEFERQGQRSKAKVTGNKKTKNTAFFSGVVLWGAVLVW